MMILFQNKARNTPEEKRQCEVTARTLKYIASFRQINLVLYSREAPLFISHFAGSLGGGIAYKQQAICLDMDDAYKANFASDALHELSHLLVRVPPNQVDEVQSPILWLDYAHHRMLKMLKREYRAFMDNFTLGEDDTSTGEYADWWQEKAPQRAKLLAASRTEAERFDLVNGAGEPRRMWNDTLLTRGAPQHWKTGRHRDD